MDIVEDGSELSAGTYFFTPAKPIGMSPLSTSNCPVGFRQAHNKRQIDKLKLPLLPTAYIIDRL